jgi:hypothetical protein
MKGGRTKSRPFSKQSKLLDKIIKVTGGLAVKKDLK